MYIYIYYVHEFHCIRFATQQMNSCRVRLAAPSCLALKTTRKNKIHIPPNGKLYSGVILLW